MGEGMYPAGPSNVPEAVRRPSARYRRRAWLAAASLAGFLTIYLALLGGLGWVAVRLVVIAFGGWHVEWGALALAVVAVALGVHLVGRLVAARSTPVAMNELDVTPAGQPRLFAFVRRIATDVGAPVPDQVALGAGVGVALEQDVSLVNLIVRPRARLILGLGLVNTLTLAELKAVVARELAQRGHDATVAGRWSQVAAIVVWRIAMRGGWLDAWQAGLWRGSWLARAFAVVLLPGCWAVGAAVTALHAVTAPSSRAFARALAEDADRAAIAVAGSDALIGGLTRAETALDSIDAALATAEEEEAGGRAIADLFAVQRRYLDLLAAALDGAGAGAGAASAKAAPPAGPPRSWTAEPFDDARAAHARRLAVVAPADDREPWILFERPEAVRAAVTSRALLRVPALPVAPLAETLARVDRAMRRVHLAPRHRGVYLERAITRGADDLDALYGPEPAGALGEALAAVDLASLRGPIDRARALARDLAVLRSLHRGATAAAGRRIRYRGASYRRGQLPGLIAAVSVELAEARREVAARDAAVRAVHRAAARAAGRGWDEHLRGLLALVHFAEHASASLSERRAAVELAVAGANLAPYRVERRNAPLDVVLRALRGALDQVQAAAGEVELPDGVTARLEHTPWSAAFAVPGHDPLLLGERLSMVRYWTERLLRALGDLRRAALDELLVAEVRCAAWAQAGEPASEAAPAPARVPARGPRMPHGSEPPRAIRLDAWSRLRIADGPIATGLRLAAATALAGGLTLAALGEPQARVVIHNGLGREVVVTVGDRTVTVAPEQQVWLVRGGGPAQVSARTTEGETIEAFDVEIALRDCNVYNVAGAASLAERVYTYRDPDDDDRSSHRDEMIATFHTERWFTTGARHIFTEPPLDLALGDDRARTRRALAAQPVDPEWMHADDEDWLALWNAHARWDATDAPYFVRWFDYTIEGADHAAVLAARVAQTPDDPVLRWLEQGLDIETACRSHVARAAAQPEDVAWQALAARCDGDLDRRVALTERWPHDPWVQLVAGEALAMRGDLETAARTLEAGCIALPGPCTYLQLAVTRLRRATGRPHGMVGGVALHRDIDRLVAPEPGTWQHALDAGDLDAALARAETDDRAQVAGLVMASDALSDATAARAHALEEAAEHWTPATALVDYARARRGRLQLWDTAASDAAETAAEGDALGAERIEAFLAVLESRTPTEAAGDAALGAVPLRLRGRAYVAAVVLLGDRCPPRWRTLAKQLLFAGERPYFR